MKNDKVLSKMAQILIDVGYAGEYEVMNKEAQSGQHEKEIERARHKANAMARKKPSKLGLSRMDRQKNELAAKSLYCAAVMSDTNRRIAEEDMRKELRGLEKKFNPNEPELNRIRYLSAGTRGAPAAHAHGERAYRFWDQARKRAYKSQHPIRAMLPGINKKKRQTDALNKLMPSEHTFVPYDGRNVKEHSKGIDNDMARAAIDLVFSIQDLPAESRAALVREEAKMLGKTATFKLANLAATGGEMKKTALKRFTGKGREQYRQEAEDAFSSPFLRSRSR